MRALFSSMLAAAAVLAASVPTVRAFQSVRVIQARVQGDAPEWHGDKGTFVSAFGRSFAEKYRAVFDSVNTASVEGALMYVQAEGINVRQNPDCRRKNNMQYIVFYELRITQPEGAMAAYANDTTSLPEYSPFVAMDGGACTPTGSPGGPGDGGAGGAILPRECKAFFGGDGQGRLGPSVGASLRETDPRAPYPQAVWFSFPNSCVMKGWKDKDSACRQQFPGGLCAYGAEPDGQVCTFTYKTLGYIRIDDLVGITELTHSTTGARYNNYTEFCTDKAGKYKGIEFSAPEGTTDNAQVTSLPFWASPFDPESNRQRARQLVETYNRRVNPETHMIPLPSPETLAQENPPCHVNSKRCAAAPFGCKRELFAQVCRICEREEEGCVRASYNLRSSNQDEMRPSIGSVEPEPTTEPSEAS